MKKTYFFFLCVLSLAGQGLSAQTFSSVDIFSGATGSSPFSLTPYNGKVYFAANGDVTSGIELWVSDGTTAGTSMLKDLNPGAGNSNPNFFTVINGKLFFRATDDTHGTELWVTDGTSAGTVMLADIWAGTGSSSPQSFTEMNGKAYFSANDSIHGNELWVSDGTPGGTGMLKDINPGTGNSDPFGVTLTNGRIYNTFTLLNGKLYFSAADDVYGNELWVTDGTTIGTTRVTDIWAGPGSGNPNIITAYNNNSLIFTAQDSMRGGELWISDGTAGGTSLLKDINPGMPSSSVGSNSGFTLYNGKLYFQAVTPSAGLEMWATDGSTGGTTMIKDIWPGPGSSNAGFYGFTLYNGKLYFGAADSLNGMQLWMSDGTGANTSLLKVLSTYTPYSCQGAGYTVYNGQLLFSASIDTVTQRVLWASDGTAGGTHIISPAVAPNANPLGTFTPFAQAGGKLFMNANFNGIGDELWIYSTPNAIIETSGEQSISAYPNPFSSSLNLSGLQSSEHYTLQITDMTGREYYSYEINHPSQNVTVNMPELTTGLYLMHVSGQSGGQTFRLVRN